MCGGGGGVEGEGEGPAVQALASEARATFFAISASSLTSQWHGEGEKLVRMLFKVACAMQPSIIFVGALPGPWPTCCCHSPFIVCDRRMLNDGIVVGAYQCNYSSSVCITDGEYEF